MTQVINKIWLESSSCKRARSQFALQVSERDVSTITHLSFASKVATATVTNDDKNYCVGTNNTAMHILVWFNYMFPPINH